MAILAELDSIGSGLFGSNRLQVIGMLGIVSELFDYSSDPDESVTDACVFYEILMVDDHVKEAFIQFRESPA